MSLEEPAGRELVYEFGKNKESEVIPLDTLGIELAEKDPDEVVVDDEGEDEVRLLSSLKCFDLLDDCFVDMAVPVEFATILENSKYPLMKNIDIVNTNSIHAPSARVELCSGSASWDLFSRMLQTFEESCGGEPPIPIFTPAEMLSKKISGDVFSQ